LEVDTKPITRQKPQQFKCNTKLKVYSGGPDIEQFLTQFKLAARLNCWPEEEWGIILATHLDGPARKLLSRDSAAPAPNYNELSSQLIARFSNEGQPSYFAALLQSRTRRDKEGVHELKNAIEEIAERAYPGMDALQRRRVCLEPFINALTDEEQRQSVRLSRPKDIDEAAEAAVVYESAIKTENRRKGTVPKRVRAVTMDQGDDKTLKYIDYEGAGFREKGENYKQKSFKNKWSKQNNNKSRALESYDDKRSNNVTPEMKQMSEQMTSMATAVSNLASQVAQVSVKKDTPHGVLPSRQLVVRQPSSARQVSDYHNDRRTPQVAVNECFQCGQRGHWKRDCPQRRMESSNQQGNEQGRRPDGQGTGHRN
jgi:hypothetical protein